MSLKDDIKKGMFAAMKAKNITDKEILRVALGEIDTQASRAPDEHLKDEEIQAILKKLIKSNRETLAATADPETKTKLLAEVAALQKFLPQTLTLSQVVELLDPVKEPIRAAANQGPAMGIAMKLIKEAGAEVNGPDVAQAVSAIRGT